VGIASGFWISSLGLLSDLGGWVFRHFGGRVGHPLSIARRQMARDRNTDGFLSLPGRVATLLTGRNSPHPKTPRSKQPAPEIRNARPPRRTNPATTSLQARNSLGRAEFSRAMREILRTPSARLRIFDAHPRVFLRSRRSQGVGTTTATFRSNPIDIIEVLNRVRLRNQYKT